MDEWDLLSAYDEDVAKREKQFQRPEFFAKPRPKLIAKKRQTIDPRAALKKNQDTSKAKATTTITSSTSRKATTPNRAANKVMISRYPPLLRIASHITLLSSIPSRRPQQNHGKVKTRMQ